MGDGEGEGSLACCSPWVSKVSDTTEQLNSNKIVIVVIHLHKRASQVVLEVKNLPTNAGDI